MKIKGDLGQIQLSHLPEPGIRDFEIVDAREETQGALDVLKLKLKIFSKGTTYIMNDEIIADDVYKISKFIKATGIEHVIKQGQLCASDCLHMTGKIRLFIRRKTDSLLSKLPNDENAMYVCGGNGYIPK